MKRPLSLNHHLIYLVLVVYRWLSQGLSLNCIPSLTPIAKKADRVVLQSSNKPLGQTPIIYAKLFGKNTDNSLPIDKPHTTNDNDNHELPSNYDRNRKILARVFIVWSIILIALLFDVLGVF